MVSHCIWSKSHNLYSDLEDTRRVVSNTSFLLIMDPKATWAFFSVSKTSVAYAKPLPLVPHVHKIPFPQFIHSLSSSMAPPKSHLFRGIFHNQLTISYSLSYHTVYFSLLHSAGVLSIYLPLVYIHFPDLNTCSTREETCQYISLFYPQ